MICFADGHVKLTRIFWNSNLVEFNGQMVPTVACQYDPPSGYDYKWSGD